jgi:hypothetical protein
MGLLLRETTVNYGDQNSQAGEEPGLRVLVVEVQLSYCPRPGPLCPVPGFKSSSALVLNSKDV